MKLRRIISSLAYKIFGVLATINLAFTLFQSYLGYSIQEFITNEKIQTLVYGAFFVSLVWRIVELELELNEIKDSRPNIVTDKNGFDKLETPFPLWNNNVHSNFNVKRYYLKISNAGKVDTTPVHAAISIFDTNNNELEFLSHEKPFWFDDKPRVQRSGSETHIIRALSKPEGICLVIKKEDDKDLYVFSDDSYFPGTSNIVFNEFAQDSFR